MYLTLGDFRQWVGEDKDKVQNIVTANHPEFTSIYHTYLNNLVEYSEGNMIKVYYYNDEFGMTTMTVCFNEQKIEVLRSSLERLPRTVRQHIKNGQSLDKGIIMPIAWTCKGFGEGFVYLTLFPALNAIVRSSSIMQSSKGILTAGEFGSPCY